MREQQPTDGSRSQPTSADSSRQALIVECHRQIRRCGQLSELTLTRLGTGGGWTWGSEKALRAEADGTVMWQWSISPPPHHIPASGSSFLFGEKDLSSVWAFLCSSSALPAKFLSTLGCPLSLSANGITSPGRVFEIHWLVYRYL